VAGRAPAGHSSGGFVISGVAARVGHRISKLVDFK